MRTAKFHRERDQRRALVKSLAEALIVNESIETTLPKAKAVVSYTERLITKAKAGGLANRRRVISGLATKEAANKLFDQISPQLTGRNSGYFRIKRTTVRQGDRVQLANVAFVDKLSEVSVPKTEPKKQVKKTTQPKPKAAPNVKSTKEITPHQAQNKEPAKRAGRRGNR